jgi:hypothetical protein
MDTVEEPTPSETKGAGSRGGVGNVKAPASPARERERERENVGKKLWRMLRI